MQPPSLLSEPPLPTPSYSHPVPWHWILVTLLVGVFYALVPLHAMLEAPWTGMWLDQKNERALVRQVVPGSPAALAGIRAGDTLLQVQRQPIAVVAVVRDRDYLPTWELDRQFWASREELERKVKIGVPLHLTLSQPGKVRALTIVPVSAPLIPALKRILPIGLAGMLFLVVGLFVATRLWNLSARLNLLGGTSVYVTAFCLAGFNSRDLAYPVQLHYFLQVSNEIAVLLLAGAYTHFGWIFPRPHPFLKRHPRLPWLLWSGMAALGLVHYTKLLPGPLLATNASLLFGCVFLLTGILTGASSLQSATHRRQLQWFVIGLACGILPIILFTLLPLIMGLPFVPQEITALSAILVPISMAISISRWRLIELPMLLARTLATGLSLLTLILGSVGLLRMLEGSPELAPMRTPAWGLFLLAAILIHPYLRRLFFRIFQGLGQRPLLGVDHVLEHFLHVHAQGNSVRSCLEETFRDTLNIPTLNEHDWLTSHRSAVLEVLQGRSRPLPGEDLAEWIDQEVPSEIEACVLIGLGQTKEFLTLGPRWNPDGWTRGDMEILGALCAIATPLIQAEEARSQAEELRRQQLESARITLELRVEERTRELENANGKLSQALLAREDFLAAMSHELRTPLSTVLGAAETILAGIDGPPTPAMQERLASMLRNGRHLRELIGDVLDFARGRAGRLPVQREPFLVQTICQEAIDLVRLRHHDHDQPIECRFPEGAVAALGDPLRTRQILTNLLANAQLHGAGQILLTLEVREDHVHFCVCDQGAGVPPEKAARLFQAFERLDQDHTAGTTGSGLGLALSRMLAGLMQGSLTYSPRPTGGSCFELVLPASTDLPATEAPSDGGGDMRPEAGYLVLVEDHAELRELLEDYLSAQGWEIDIFPEATSALASCKTRMPDALLTDLGLPGISGLELVRQIRAQPGGEALHIVVLTGQVMPEDTRNCLEAGADAVLPKPFPLAKLDRILRELTANRPHD
jgi:signal transduction histidine kinase/CheY-like chemotaxis protein